MDSPVTFAYKTRHFLQTKVTETGFDGVGRPKAFCIKPLVPRNQIKTFWDLQVSAGDKSFTPPRDMPT